MSCYICQEDTEEVSQCVCKARVHAGCLLALAVEEKRVHEFYELLIGCTSAVGWALVASSCLQKILHDHELVAEYEEYEYCATGNRLASTWPPRASA